MALLSKSQMLAADDKKTEIIPVPEWGGDVKVRALTGTERGVFEGRMSEKKGEFWSNYRPWLVAQCVVDEAGARVFTNGDVLALGAKSSAAISRISQRIFELSGIDAEAQKEIEKNSEPTASDDSV